MLKQKLMTIKEKEFYGKMMKIYVSLSESIWLSGESVGGSGGHFPAVAAGSTVLGELVTTDAGVTVLTGNLPVVAVVLPFLRDPPILVALTITTGVATVVGLLESLLLGLLSGLGGIKSVAGISICFSHWRPQNPGGQIHL